MADSNILRVGAEFDVSAIIDGTAQAVASIDELQNSLAQIAANAEAVDDKLTENAARFMASGLSAQDATQNLIRFGYGEKEAEAAVKAITDALAAQSSAQAAQSASTQQSSTATSTQTATIKTNIATLQQRAAAQTTTATAQTAANATTTAATAATHLNNVATAQQVTVSGNAAAQIAALQQQVAALTARVTQLAQQLANARSGLGGMGSASAAARAEMGALTDSTGMALGGMARMAAQSKILAPLIAAAFPVFAILIFIEVLDTAIKKLEEWADAARKSADEQAAFERSMMKSGEAANQAKERLVGLSSASGELAQKVEDSGSKVLDLSESVKKLNERQADTDGFFKTFKQGAGDLFTVVGESVGALDKSERSLKEWNSRIAEGYKQNKDLASAVLQVKESIRELEATRMAITAEEDNTADLKKYDTWITNQRSFLKSLEGDLSASQTSLRTMQIESDQKTLEEHEKIMKARASFDEADARSQLRAHAVTFEQERTLMLSAESERSRAEESIITSRIALIQTEAREKIISQEVANASIRELTDERTVIEVNAATKRMEINRTTDDDILRRDVETGDARIESTHKVTEAINKLEEQRAKRSFQDADTVHEVESASVSMVKASTASYQEQIRTLQQRAALMESTLKINQGGVIKQAVTADLGSDDFTKQVEQIKNLDEQKYRQLLAFDQQVRELQIKEVNDSEASEKEKSDKIKRIRTQELNDQISMMNARIEVENTSYSESTAKLDAQLARNKGLWSSYYDSIAALANKSYTAQIEILTKEASETRAAVEAKTITEEQGSKRLTEIYDREEKAYNEMQKREVEAAKRAVTEEENEIKSVTEKISQDFVQSFNSVIEGHKRVGQAALELAGKIELSLIDRGIKTVVQKYTENLLKIVAEHSSMLAKVLGIHVAGANAQSAVDAKQALQKETFDITEEEKQRAANAAQLADYQATQLGETASHTAAITAQSADDAAKVLKSVAANDTIITSDAGLAGAAAFASVMEALPFPENVATAPEVTAATIGAVLANLSIGSAERGAMLDRDMMVAAHAGEMILPSNIAGAVKGAVPAINTFNRSVTNSAASSSSVVQKSMTNHIHINIPPGGGGGGIDHDAIIASVMRGIRMGALKLDAS
jgi:hypothetical protein